MKTNILKKYLMIAFATLLQAQITLLNAETWVDLPYPDEIKNQIKDDNKKVDLDDDPLYLGSLNELFDSAQTDSIIIAGILTKGGENQLTVSYDNALSFFENYFVNYIDSSQVDPINHYINNYPNVIKNLKTIKLLITPVNYYNLKRAYKKGHANYGTGDKWFSTAPLTPNEVFGTKPPFFIDPFNNLPIQNVCFFKITRTKQDESYDYKAEYIGNLDNIVKSPDKIAELQFELINNFEGDMTAKAAEFKNIIKKYKDVKENSIAKALEELLPENRNVSPEEKKKRLLKKAIDDILQNIGQDPLTSIKQVFDLQIKPYDIKIPLKDFQNIIEKKKNLFGVQVNHIFDIIHDYAPLIEEYDLDKDNTIEALNTQFINHIYELYPKLSSIVKLNVIRNLKKIKTNNDALQSVITSLIEDYEKQENKSKLAKILIETTSKQLSAEELIKIFKDEIKPLKVTMPLSVFKSIIKKNEKSLAFYSQLFWQLINDNMPLITEYINNKEKTTQELYAEFIRIIKEFGPRVLPDSKAEFISNLKKIVTTNNEIKMAIATIINNYDKEQEREHTRKKLLFEKTFTEIQDAQSGKQAAKLFDTLTQLNMHSTKTNLALEMVINTFINKDNDPNAAFLFFLKNGSYHDQQELNSVINKIITTAKQRLLSLTPQEEYAFIASFKKIGADNRLFKDVIEKAITHAKKDRAVGEKTLLDLARALKSL